MTATAFKMSGAIAEEIKVSKAIRMSVTEKSEIVAFDTPSFKKLDVKNLIKTKIDLSAFNAWIEPLGISEKDDVITLAASSKFNADYIRTTFEGVFSDIENEFGKNIIVSTGGRPALRVIANDNNTCALKSDFSDFICSEQNQFALSAVKKCTASKISFSPLVIYGPSGSGKSLLLSLIQKNTDQRIFMTTGAGFMSDFVRTIKDGTIFAFRDMVRVCDTFIMDDVQGLAGKRASAEEFMITLSDLIRMGKNVVLTSNIAPSQITGFDKRLVSLLASGLSVDLALPDKTISEKILIKNGILDSLAKNISQRIPLNGHILSGVSKKISTWSELSPGKIDDEILERLLGDVMTKQNTPLVMVKNMCAKLGIAFDDVMSSTRTHAIVFARQKIMVALKMSTKLTLAEIGRLVGGRDHASVLYAISQIEKAKESDMLIDAELSELIK